MSKLCRILVVDGSRVVRATLRKHLKDDFEIVEENDGESAWQTLMLDASVDAVISGIHTPKLEAYDLIARMRASAKRRLRDLPFALIVSDIGNPAERAMDRVHGAKAFISKSMKKAAIIDCVNNLLAPDVLTYSDVLPELTKGQHNKTEPSCVPPAELKTVLGVEQFSAEIAGYPISESGKESVCALVFSIDNIDGLSEKFDESVVEMIAARFAGLLVAKVGKLDSIGHYGGNRLAIFSHGVDLKQGVKFGKNVCKSLASGQITIRGEKVKLTASVGVASTSDAAVASGIELLGLAEKNLEQALVCGGNNVVTEYRPDCPLHGVKKTPHALIHVVNARGSKELAKNVGTLGLQLLPLMRVMDKELQLGLPLADIKRQLEQRARIEGSTP